MELNFLPDMEHSNIPARLGGGQIRHKLVSSMDSLSRIILGKDGQPTSLRAFILTKKYPETEKPLFSSVKIAATKGNKTSIQVELTASRSSTSDNCKRIAEEAERYILNGFASDVLAEFGKVQAESILARSTLENLAQDTSVTQADMLDVEIPLDIDLDSTSSMSNHSEWQTQATTQSTRNALALATAQIQQQKEEHRMEMDSMKLQLTRLMTMIQQSHPAATTAEDKSEHGPAGNGRTQVNNTETSSCGAHHASDETPGVMDG